MLDVWVLDFGCVVFVFVFFFVLWIMFFVVYHVLFDVGFWILYFWILDFGLWMCGLLYFWNAAHKNTKSKNLKSKSKIENIQSKIQKYKTMKSKHTEYTNPNPNSTITLSPREHAVNYILCTYIDIRSRL